jgi:glycolate oxidase
MVKLNESIVRELQEALGKDKVLTAPEELIVHSYDATWPEAVPGAVVLPLATEDVVITLRIAERERIPVVPRGAATGLAGGSVPLAGSIALNMARMNKILEISPEDLVAVVQPGVVNQDLQQAAARYGLFFPPDPASYYMSTLGGNVAANAGGPRCLKYGVTTDYVLGLEVVLPGGKVMRTGGRTIKNVAGYDLTRLIVGSEGTLGVVTEITVKLLPLPKAKGTVLALFRTLEEACEAMEALLSGGVLPLTTELMDDLSIRAVEGYMEMGVPKETGGLLLIDVDGWPEGMESASRAVEEICRKSGALEVQRAVTAEESEKLWTGRRAIAGAMRHLGADNLSEDLAVPRSKIPEMARRIRQIAAKYDLLIPVFGHAGDGNLHPNIICDRRDPQELKRVEQAAAEIMDAALELGGTITGEHGIGLAKLDFVLKGLDPVALETMRAIKQLFDPHNIMNPGKVFPDSKT